MEVTMRVVPAIEDPRNHGGWFVAFWKTVLACFVCPRQLFTAIAHDDPQPNWLFGAICTHIGAALTTTLSFWLDGQLPTKGLHGTDLLIMSFAWVLLMVLLSPLGIVLGYVSMLLETALLHGLVWLFAGVPVRGWNGTLKVVSYARPIYLIPRVVLRIPVLGWIWVIWWAVLVTLGLSRMHKLPAWRIVVALVVTTLLLGLAIVLWKTMGVPEAPSTSPTSGEEVIGTVL